MSEIKQINTGVAELLAVKVPEGASDFCVPNDIYLSSLPVLQWWIAKDGIVNEVGSTTLPPGNWTPLGLSDQLTEEQAREVIPLEDGCHYLDYVLFRGHLQNYVNTAKEAFASLMQANWCFSVNPYGITEPKDVTPEEDDDLGLVSTLRYQKIAQWRVAQKNTGKWLILKRLS